MKTALTIAGSDCSGGAGIQADIKTMCMNGVYAMSAVTALTVQNTLGVTGISEVSPEFLRSQLDAVFTDIFPDAVKIGMVSSPALVEVIAERLAFYGAKNVVVDPVMVATSGSKLISDEARAVLVEKLLPLAAVITPNIPEAEILSGMTVSSKEEMEIAAKRIGERLEIKERAGEKLDGKEQVGERSSSCAVLLKGGHSICDADDYLWTPRGGMWFCGKRINNPNTHGTGCTLSSAIAAELAKGEGLEVAVLHAKTYISNCLEAELNLGHGSGPLMHNYALLEKN
ncbi:MAG: bifunctional hydroxymethylpyrimidine kinase/phosphomethylpyrimidine kinase [Clostridiales bacterium]|nr:bifunctional hydroxymethylpyrimidine kinase/phosphomethylpyrimidine kinase [Clostridiales bacterium]